MVTGVTGIKEWHNLKSCQKNKLWYFVKQKGKCAYCQLNFIGDELMELDHIQPKYLGGTNESNNFQLLHRHCHHLKTSHDRSQLAPQKVNL